MNMMYFLALTIGAVICAGLFAWKLRRAGLKTMAAWIALPLSAVLGLVMARLIYFALEFRDMYVKYDGFAGLLSANPKEFSVIGGCLGVILAVILTAKITRHKPMQLLDAFAPTGALMLAVARCCEGLIDPMKMIGMGAWVDQEALHFFPLAVEVEWVGTFYAVFMLEAALALLCALVAFVISHRGGFKPGRVFLHTVTFLALPQIFCEQILGDCMVWGFVKIEQLLCALIVFGVILNACIRMRKLSAYVPAVLCLLCAAVLIWMEFTLDNKLLFGIEIPTIGCYAIMIAAIGCMGGLEQWAYRKLNKAA